MSNLDLVLDYLMDNYYDDVERMAKIKMIAAMANQGWGEHDMPSMVDKIALFNGIKKSYKPEAEELAKEFIEGIGFVMTLEKASKEWEKS